VNLPPLLLDHQRLRLVCGFPIAVSPSVFVAPGMHDTAAEPAGQCVRRVDFTTTRWLRRRHRTRGRLRVLFGLERAALALRHHADFGTRYGFLPTLGFLEVWGHAEELQGNVVGILGVQVQAAFILDDP
jgi:hypothetical protein